MQPRLLAWALFAVVGACQMCGGQSTSANPASMVAIDHSFGQIPLTFEVNRGQTDPKVKFLSRRKGYTAFLTSGGMVLSLHPSTSGEESAQLRANPRTSRRPASVELKLMGAAKNPTVVGEDLQPGKVNYFFGNDPTKWKTNIATYGRVRYKNVYSGIDVLYYGNHRQLEYDFEIQAGADPAQIQFEVNGVDQCELDAEGNLLLTLGSQQFHLQSPSVYQQSNNQRMVVNGSYVLTDSKHFAFKVASYDPKSPLVIDPVLIYSTYLGSSDDEAITGLAVDSVGSLYVGGFAQSVDFPVTSPGPLASGNDHAFVAKLDPTGSYLVYADYIGGSSMDLGYALTIDAEDDVYLAGSTSSNNFPTVNAYQATNLGSYNTFLTEISADGASILYSTYLGGNGSDWLSAVAIDAVSDVYLTGYTSSTNFPMVNAYQSTVSPNQGGNYGFNGFVTKFEPGGSSLAYSTYIGGSSNVQYSVCDCWGAPESVIVGLALDSSENAYIAGNTNTYNFPTTSGAYESINTAPNNSVIGFVTKFSSSGSLDYSTYFYESSGYITNLNAIAVDGSGSAYVTGMAANDGTFPVTSTSICNPALGAECDWAFVTKFDATASTLLYSTFLGPNNSASPAAIALDQNNDAYVLATTSSSSFVGANPIESYTGGYDLLLTEIDPSASSELFATYLGGAGGAGQTGESMSLDSSGDVYVAGTTTSTDFPTTPGAFQTQSGGNSDLISGFVMKIGPAAAPAVSLTPYSLQYATSIGSTSQPQQVLLRNMGSTALSITSITASQEFEETDNCTLSVPAAGTCTLSVTFLPALVGQQIGSISIKDNAAGSPHIVSLEGTGAGNPVRVSPATLTFPSTPIRTTSAVQIVTLINQDVAGLPITSIQVSGDYAQTNNCPASLASGYSCTITITFGPTATGTRSGELTINDGAIGSPQTVVLSGSGVDFSLTSSVTSSTVEAGGSATYILMLAGVGGAFNNSVALSCSGLPANSQCTLSPTSATPGTGSTSITVTIATTASTAKASAHVAGKSQWEFAFWMQPTGFGVVGLFLSVRKSRRKIVAIVALALIIAPVLLISGCAGGTGIALQGNSGTLFGTYPITVTGSSGSLQHSLVLSLTVN